MWKNDIIVCCLTNQPSYIPKGVVPMRYFTWRMPVFDSADRVIKFLMGSKRIMLEPAAGHFVTVQGKAHEIVALIHTGEEPIAILNPEPNEKMTHILIAVAEEVD